jgi:hypothetical protein
MTRTKNTNSPPEIIHPDVERPMGHVHDDTSTDSRSPTRHFTPPTTTSRPKAQTSNSTPTSQSSALISPPVPTTITAVSTTPAATSSQVKWVDNNGVRYPFPAYNEDYEGDDVFDPIQFETIGIVTTSFLNAGAVSHTIKFTIPKEDIERIKALVRSSSEFQPGDEFHWPFVDGVATANNKDNLTCPFENVYDGRNKGNGENGEEDELPAHRIRMDVKVRVEYIPTVWSVKKSKNGTPVKSGGSGCSLKLMAIILLEERYSFESPRKRRRIG